MPTHARHLAPGHTAGSPFVPPAARLAALAEVPMHALSPPSAPVVVLPPLAPGYAWTFTPHGWCPMPYDGPTLAPRPATPRARSTSTEAPALPPASAPPTSSTTDTADPLADVPPEVRARGQHDGRVACALGYLVEARQAHRAARRALGAAMKRHGPIPSDPAQVHARLVQLVRDWPDVRDAWIRYEHAYRASERAAQALTAAVQPPAALGSERHDPPAAAAEPSPPEPRAAAQLDAAQLDAAAQLRNRDPDVARALDAHTEAMEHARATAETFAAALAPHGPGPEEPDARATWVRDLAERNPVVAIAVVATLAALTAAEHTAAQLAAALGPHAARAPPGA